MRFEGGYLNGKRNGKGKEYYDNGKLKFEGEYLNGKRNGKGKEYYFNNISYGDVFDYSSIITTKLMFEGEFLNGIRWNGKIFDKDNNFTEIKNGKGNIKVFNQDGDLIFEGEYLNGKRNGKGKEYNKYNKLIFDGEFKNDKRWNGKGYDGLNNLAYELINGKGKVKDFEYGNFRFEGEYLNGERNGKGKEFYESGDLLFEGEYLNGKKNGKGKEYYGMNELKYDGEYLNGEKNGKGKEYSIDGKLKFEGIYLYSFKLSGKEYLKGKLEYEGDYLYNKKWNGKGYNENGEIIYVLYNGNGKIREYDDDCKLKFEGEYLNGKKSGKGKEYKSNGMLSYYGEYLDGKRWNGIGKEISFCIDDLHRKKYVSLLEYEYLNGVRFNSEVKIN